MFPWQNEPYTGMRRHPIRRPGILSSIASEKSVIAAPRRKRADLGFPAIRWSILGKAGYRFSPGNATDRRTWSACLFEPEARPLLQHDANFGFRH
jgi:hypothetical protein